jgi:hypothetical protein
MEKRERFHKSIEMNKLSPIFIILVTITVVSALAKSDLSGGYITGFARGVEEANEAITQFDNGSKSIDADKPPSCPLADKQDDYCDGWRDRILDVLG